MIPFSIIKILKIRYKKQRFISQFSSFGIDSGFGIMGYGDTCRIWDKRRIAIGNHSWFGRDSIIQVLGSYQYGDQKQELESGLEIGNRVHCTEKCWILCAGHMNIQDDVLIAPEVLIIDNNHGMIPSEGGYSAQPLCIRNVSIEQGVWIGQRSTILPGVTIGEWSIVGANSVVTCDVPPYTMVAGNPAKVIKRWNHDTRCWEKAKN